MKNKIFNIAVRITAVATILSSLAMTAPVKGADIEYASDTMTRLKISENANHTILFWTPTGIGNGSTVTVEFDTSAGNAFDFTGVVAADADLYAAAGAGTDCANATYSTLLDTDGDSFTNDIVTFTSGAAVATNFCIQVRVGTNADGGVNQVNNPSSADTYQIGIAGTMDDSGSIAVPIVDDDQVTVTANVDPSMLFDLDTSIATGAETAAPYTVDFGTLDPTDAGVNMSGDVDIDSAGTDVNYIHMDLETNATHGAVVTIQNANGTNGMISTSGAPDNIVNANETTVVGGAEAYGFCVGGTYETSGAAMSIAAGDWTTYSANCADGGGTHYDTLNDIVGLQSTPDDIITVAGPVAGGEAYLIGSADASVLTEAHDDYVDTLTFIATATF